MVRHTLKILQHELFIKFEKYIKFFREKKLSLSNGFSSLCLAYNGSIGRQLKKICEKYVQSKQ